MGSASTADLAIMAFLEPTDRSLRSGTPVAIRDIVGAAAIAR